MDTIIYKLNENYKKFDGLVKEDRESNFFRIEKSVESVENVARVVGATTQYMHVIYLVTINKTSFEETRFLLAKFVGKESQMTLLEEERLMVNLNTKLYTILKKDYQKGSAKR